MLLIVAAGHHGRLCMIDCSAVMPQIELPGLIIAPVSMIFAFNAPSLLKWPATQRSCVGMV